MQERSSGRFLHSFGDPLHGVLRERRAIRRYPRETLKSFAHRFREFLKRGIKRAEQEF